MRKNKTARRFVAFAAVVILLVAIAVYAGEHLAVRDFLIPGDPVVTKAAMSELVSNVKSGEPIADAVTVFCRQIITAADEV